MAEKRVPGIRIVDQWEAKGHRDCKRWLFRVWDRWARNWKSEAYADDDKASGWLWAERERAKFTLGEARAGRVTLASLAADYVASLNDAGREKAYVKDVKRVLDHLVAKGVVDLQADDFAPRVRTLLAAMKPFAKGRLKPIGGKTRNRWLRQVRQCIRHGLITHAIRHDPLAPLHRFHFKEDIVLPETMTLAELRALVDGRNRRHPEFLKVAIMIYTGMRSREASHVRWEWIDWKAGFIRVRLRPDFKTKRNKERLIPLQAELAALLEKLDGRQLHGWVIDEAQRARKDWQHYEAFKAYVAACGITRTELHPHSTRHTWTALMLATNASATLVRRALGHAALTTTDIYADAEMTLRREIANADWPADPGEFWLRRVAPRQTATRARPASPRGRPSRRA